MHKRRPTPRLASIRLKRGGSLIRAKPNEQCTNMNGTSAPRMPMKSAQGYCVKSTMGLRPVPEFTAPYKAHWWWDGSEKIRKSFLILIDWMTHIAWLLVEQLITRVCDPSSPGQIADNRSSRKGPIEQRLRRRG